MNSVQHNDNTGTGHKLRNVTNGLESRSLTKHSERSQQASVVKPIPGSRLFRPYDPDLGSGNTYRNSNEKTSDTMYSSDHHFQCRLPAFGYTPVLSSHDGQYYLQPLPSSCAFLEHGARIVHPGGFTGSLLAGSSLLPSFLPLSPLMLRAQPCFKPYMTGTPVSNHLSASPWWNSITNTGLLKVASPPALSGTVCHVVQENDSSSTRFAIRNSYQNSSANCDDLDPVNVCD